MKRRIVLDCDLGSDVDDALCLALALCSPELELLAVTTVGNAAPLPRPALDQHLVPGPRELLDARRPERAQTQRVSAP